MMGRGMPMDVNEWVIRPLLSNLSVIGLFMIPMITMRLFAEEKRSGTIELLATSPVRDIEVILGKWLAAVVLYASVLALSGLSVATCSLRKARSRADSNRAISGCCCRAERCSRSVRSFRQRRRIRSSPAFATFAICLLLWVLDWVSSFETAAWAKVIAYMSVITHLDPFAKGVLDSKDIIFYLSVIFLGLFLTARSMESLRWRA